MPKRTVIAKLDGQIIAKNEIVLNGLNYVPIEKEFIDLAKKEMKKDGLTADQISQADYEVIM